MTRYQLINGDCRAIMANMGDGTVDAIVTDPPYHLTSIVKRFGPGQAPQQFGTDGAFARAARGFMGQTWDGGDVAFDPALWVECMRVLRPGGHVLAFGGTRTYHRLAVAIEDAGFEIRDCLFWLYGSGFPKSHDVSKALDRMAGAERPVVSVSHNGSGPNLTKLANHGPGDTGIGMMDGSGKTFNRTAPATPDALAWQGWGTALKPACEPIVMGRKPLEAGSVAANVLRHGAGAINIDGCRVDYAGEGDLSTTLSKNPGRENGGDLTVYSNGGTQQVVNVAGRFPANVLHDGSDAVVGIFPDAKGGNYPAQRSANAVCGASSGGSDFVGSTFQGDQGSAARFFYNAKASKRDRDEGCEALAAVRAGMENGSSRHLTRGDDPDYEVAKRANFHPTVKPTDVMRWLCRLVTPPGGVVFDPFTGSGSTGKAALLEGFRFIGAELTPEYIPIARARLEWAAKQRA